MSDRLRQFFSAPLAGFVPQQKARSKAVASQGQSGERRDSSQQQQQQQQQRRPAQCERARLANYCSQQPGGHAARRCSSSDEDNFQSNHQSVQPGCRSAVRHASAGQAQAGGAQLVGQRYTCQAGDSERAANAHRQQPQQLKSRQSLQLASDNKHFVGPANNSSQDDSRFSAKSQNLPQQPEEELHLSWQMSTSMGNKTSSATTNHQAQQLVHQQPVEQADTMSQYAEQLRRSQFNHFNQQMTHNKHQLNSSPAPSQFAADLLQHRTRNSNEIQAPMFATSSKQVVGIASNNNPIINYNDSNNSDGINKKDNQTDQRPLHVNFNRRSSHPNASDDEGESEMRKKKYLTAKYGQQQMSLIKKRLKIEMWLHEQLQELSKLSNSVDPDEIDEIDIDLDELLDLDGEATRRRWLRDLLRPLSDVPAESIDKFIADVLEQSKLL